MEGIIETIPYGYCHCGCGQQTPIATKAFSNLGVRKGEPRKYIHNHHMNGRTRPDRRRFTDAEEAEICRRYKDGESTTELCRDLAMNREVAWCVLRRGGVVAQRHKLTEAEQDKACELYNQGYSTEQIARRFPVNSQTILNLLERRGIQRRPSGPVAMYRDWEEAEAAKKIRALPAYRKWRAAILRRDGRACRHCGVHSTLANPLHAHHILLFSTMLIEHRPLNVEAALKYKALWDLDNGITLCLSCHRKTHFP